MMPLHTKGDKSTNKNPVDYKARLERKLYLARETPEPIFDLSDCNLKNVPNNIFSLCKVFRKEALYLQNNLLTSLSGGGSLQDLQDIKTLDISANKFSKLSSNINAFENLKVLDVSKNQLEELPESIGCLEKLVWLNLSNNNLHLLPESIGNCKSLEVLNIMFNEPLKQLPTSLGKLHSLVQLDIDSTITYPPREVCKMGVEAILSFFLKELNENVEIPSTSTKGKITIDGNSYSNLQDQIAMHEKIKQEKQKQRLDVERQLLNDSQRELELQQQLRDKKYKLLEDVKNQQKILDAELAKIQEKKNNDRALLLKLYHEEEKRSNEVVSKILNSNKKLRIQVSDIWEKDKENDEETLLSRTTQSRAIERKQILISMDELMREEISRAQNINAGRRLCAVQSLVSEISQQNEALQNLITKYDQNHTQLLESLRKNEEFQKSAVASLLEKSDAASWELAQQVAIVEEQLAELTRLELSKKKLESDCQLAELTKNRIALTKILMELFDQQTERRKQLIETMRKMETMRESIQDSETFWMEQYEKLLNSKSHQIVKFLESVNQNLAYHFFLNGVFHYLPLLKDVALSEEELKKLDMNTLSKLGIKSSEDRSSVLHAVEAFLNSKFDQKNPTAPALEEPTAPPISVSDFRDSKPTSYIVPDECVICLEVKPNVIFVPCGHICCCYKCFMSIALCPLCRKPIDEIHEMVQKFK